MNKEQTYRVPFLRTQYCDIEVVASSEDEAIDKAYEIFRSGHDDIQWEDIDRPEFDDLRGVEIV